MQSEMASHPVFGEVPGQIKRQTDSKSDKSSGKKNITTLATEVKTQKPEKGAGAGNKRTQEKGTNVRPSTNPIFSVRETIPWNNARNCRKCCTKRSWSSSRAKDFASVVLQQDT